MAKKKLDRIVLMDLNVALSSNFKDMKYHSMENFVKEVEEYREWMVDLLRPEYVVLVTARNIKWGVPTLSRLWTTQKWLPNEAIFNDTDIKGDNAPKIKKTQFLNKIAPRHGTDTQKYFAIESNPRTREMYSSLGIQSFDCERMGSWENLPF